MGTFEQLPIPAPVDSTGVNTCLAETSFSSKSMHTYK